METIARDSRPDAIGGDDPAVEPVDRPELSLVALAVALGAKEVGGSLTKSEAALVEAAKGADVPTDEVRTVTAAINRGDDPLGDRFYLLRSPVMRRHAGAVYTPQGLIVPMVRWTLDQDPARVVDAGAGSGRFASAVARANSDVAIVAVDLDPLATLMTRATLASLGHERVTVVQGDYTKARLGAVPGRTAYLGNPPYVRHHDLAPRTKAWAQMAAALIGRSISGLAGLHALFYLATAHHSRSGDVGCFVTSAEWLDVNYGRVIRELLLHNLGGEALYVIEPESLPFGDTATTAAIACFRVGSRPAKVRVLDAPSVSALPRLTGGQPIARDRLIASNRWSHFVRASKPMPEGYIELGELCRVHSGAVTGANAVWVRNRHEIDLPTDVLFPSVTKARELFAAGDRLTTLDGLRVVIDLPADLDELDPADRKRVTAFLREAKRAGVKRGYIASSRHAWWRVGLREPAPILASYMARRLPAFVRNEPGARHINVAHGLYPREPMPAKALDRLATALRTTVVLAAGRTYAGGLTKFEPREMERLPVPDFGVLSA